METKHLLNKALLTAAFALGTICAANADNVHVHDHGISDDLANEYMTRYFGWQKTTSGGKTDYYNKMANIKTPDSVAVGEVILIEVNPYWRGMYMYPTTSDKNSYKSTEGATIWEEVKYGVKAVHKVGAPTKTANGYIYSYTGKLGRFFFGKRRAKYYNENGSREFSTNYKLLGRWYDEWSFLPDNDGDAWGWANFSGLNNYAKLVNGDVWYAPHNCLNSLDKNHFASFIASGEEDYSDGYDATVLFYISDYWDSNDVRGDSKGATRNQPFICLLQSEQAEPTITPNADGTYDITITFNSTFKTISDALAEETTSGGTKGEKTWDETNGGVREFYKIYRVWTDKDGVTHRELVDEVPAPLTTDDEGNYVYTDTNDGKHFNSDKEDGTDYTYEITSEIYPVDKNGNIIKEGEEGAETIVDPISTAQAPNKTAHVPGEDSFYLQIGGGTTCTYVPSTTFGEGVNNFNHVINISVESAKDFDIKEGDYLQLVQTIGKPGTTGATEKVIQESDPATSGMAGMKISTIVGVGAWRTVTYPFTMKGGLSQDAYYKLVLMRKNAVTSEYEVGAFSNTLYLDSYRANAAAGTIKHRSGHPGTLDTSTTETYHNEVDFVPTKDGNIMYYTVICNGNKQESQTITSTLYEGGETYTQPMLHNGNIVNPGEVNGYRAETPESMFYTVIATDKNKNTYGSADVKFDYYGTPDELVYYADPSSATVTRSRTARHDNLWEASTALTLNNGNGIAAADVDPDMIIGSKTYGLFFNSEDDFKAETNGEEREFCEFDSFDAENPGNFNFFSLNVQEKESAAWSDIQSKTDENEKANLWGFYSEQFWYNYMPKYIYTEITYKTPEIQPTPSVSGVMRAEGAPTAGNIYKKYSNWAPVKLPTFGPMPVTGIETVNVEATVKVYPNPATDQISFNALGAVEIYNLAGARVVSTSGFGITTVDVSHLPAGVYILRTGNKSDKFIVTK